MTNPNDSAYPMLDSSFIASGRAVLILIVVDHLLVEPILNH